MRSTLKRTGRRAAAFSLMTVLTLALTARTCPTVSAAWPPENVYVRKANADNKIAITFDDGPNPSQTAEILDILRDFDIKATFFMVGSNAERNGELVRRIVREGHEVGSHTYSHAGMAQCTDEQLTEEIRHTEQVLFDITGVRPRLFRPPGGCCEGNVVKIANALCYEVVLWSVDTRDWAHTPVRTMVENVRENTRSGDIILCHDFVGKGTNTPDALRAFLPILLEKGFEFVKVSELLSS